MSTIDFVYAHVRLQARHAARPDASHWQRLDAVRTAGHYLAMSRSGPCARWTNALDARLEVHRLERELRAAWRRTVEAVAAWQPARWQAATRWFAALAELALVEAWRQSGAGTALAADERLAPLLQPDPIARRDALERAGRGAYLALRPGGPPDAGAVWRDEWQRRAPPGEPDAAQALALAGRWLPGLTGASGAAGGPAVARAAAADALSRDLERLLRRRGASALTVFAHLVLDALEVERLRGALVWRLMLPVATEAEAA